MGTLETRPDEGRKRAALYLLLVAAPVLAGIAVSALLLVDYLRPVPVFCEIGGGCDRIKVSNYSSLLGIPVPAYGLAGFAALGVLALFRGPRARGLQLVASAIGAVAALFFLSIQVKMGTFCPYCVVVDAAGLLALGGATLRSRRGWDPPRGAIATGGLGLALVLAGVVPVLLAWQFGKNKKIAIPAAIAEEMRRTPPGLVTVVDFVDFECPFCRMTHVEFSPLLEENASRVRVVRKQVPLKMHPNAQHAARAACCGERLGRGDEMADRLFASEDLTPAGCEKIAEAMGLSLDAFRACVNDPAIDERIKKETAEFRASGGHGLPTIWLDGQVLEGAKERETLEIAMRRALAGKS